MKNCYSNHINQHNLPNQGSKRIVHFHNLVFIKSPDADSGKVDVWNLLNEFEYESAQGFYEFEKIR